MSIPDISMGAELAALHDVSNRLQSQNKLPQRQYEAKERTVILKNVVVIGVAFMIHFTAFHGTSNLQSSVNSDMALGTITLAVIYGSLILSNIFLPMSIIRWFGIRLTMALAFFTYMPYIAAQFYPRFETLIPCGLIVGLGGGPLWCAKCTYLSTVAEASTHVKDQYLTKDVNTVKFFSLFFTFYQMAQVWGNLITSSVLSFTNVEQENNSIEFNSTDTLVSKLCGSRFCPGMDMGINPNLIPPDPSKIKLLNSIFLVCMVLAVCLIIFGVNPLSRYGVRRQSAGEGMSGWRLLSTTLRHLRKGRQLLMLPITMFIGLEQSFLAVDFTKSFVACGWGIPNIGFAMICFGVANAVSAAFAGSFVERFGRSTLTMVCALMNLLLLGYMWYYEAQQNDYIKYCAFAAIWGICDGIWLIVINAFYGILFPKDLIAAYSNFRLWESCGSVVGYILSSQLCTSTKLIILMAVLLTGCIGYLLVEFNLRKSYQSVEIEETK